MSIIEFSDEAKASFGAAMRRIVDTVYNTSMSTPNVQPSSLDISQYQSHVSRSKCFTTLTDLTEDGLVVNEIDGSLMNRLIEQTLVPMPSRIENFNDVIQAAKDYKAKKAKSKSTKKQHLVRNSYRYDLRWGYVNSFTKVFAIEYLRCFCPECSVEMIDLNSWKTHIWDVHKFSEISSKFRILGAAHRRKYACNECHLVITKSSFEKLLYHYITHSPNPICFACRFCNWRHYNISVLTKHVRAHHLSKKKPKVEPDNV